MSSNEMTLKTRIIHKHETEADWLKATGFTPLQGELIIYDIDDTHDYERFKIGDDKTNVNDLPFMGIYGKKTEVGYHGYELSSYSHTRGNTDATLVFATAPKQWKVGENLGVIGYVKLYNRFRIKSISGTTVVITDTQPYEEPFMYLPTGIANPIYLWTSSAMGSEPAWFINNAHPYDGTLLPDNFAANAIGEETKARGRAAVAGGRQTAALGDYSATFGRQNTVGYGAFAAGRNNQVYAEYGLGIGSGNVVTGQTTAAIGFQNAAAGRGAIALGSNTQSWGEYSFTQGIGTAAGNGNHRVDGKEETSAQAAFGTYNIENPDALLMIGNGTSASSRSNAFEILKDGRAVIAKAPEEDMDVTNKFYVDNKINDLPQSSRIPNDIIDEICVMTTQINMLEGDGQSINTYAFAPLSFRSEGPIDTFESVKVNGETVDPSNYVVTEGSTIVTFNEEWTKALSEGEHDVEIIHSIGTASASMNVFNENVLPDGSSYTTSDGESYNSGDQFQDVSIDDIFEYGDYQYKYKKTVVNVTTVNADGTQTTKQTEYFGWNVSVIDKTKTEYGPILESIGGEPVMYLDGTFNGCSNLVDASNIKLPNKVLIMSKTFNNCSKLVVAPAIPTNIVRMERTFYMCDKLKDISRVVIPESTLCLKNTFSMCSSLEGTLIINTDKTNNDSQYGTDGSCFQCFQSVDMSKITLTGSAPINILNKIGNTGQNWVNIE